MGCAAPRIWCNSLDLEVAAIACAIIKIMPSPG